MKQNKLSRVCSTDWKSSLNYQMNLSVKNSYMLIHRKPNCKFYFQVTASRRLSLGLSPELIAVEQKMSEVTLPISPLVEGHKPSSSFLVEFLAKNYIDYLLIDSSTKLRSPFLTTFIRCNFILFYFNFLNLFLYLILFI